VRRYILRRLLLIPVLLLGITVLDYVFISVAPGDPITAMMDPEIMLAQTPEYIEARKRELGLDQPIMVRYAAWVKEVATGNLGYSIIRRRPVAELMYEAWRNTILLVVVSLVLSTLAGIALGLLSSMKPYSLLDYGLTFLAFVGAAIPSFFFAMILINVFALQLRWFPTSGITSPVPTGSELLDRLHHMVLPLAALTLFSWGGLLRFVRSSMIEALGQDYVRVARAKGLGERVVVMRHAFKNAMLPLVTLLGLSLPELVGGAFVIETLFNYPGIGQLMVDSTLKRDYPMMMGGLLVGAVTVLTANLLTDVAYAWVDPRIHYD